MMEADSLVFCIIVLLWKFQMRCMGASITGHEYKIVDLEESRSMCGGSRSLVSNRIGIKPETPAVIRLGHTTLQNPAIVDRCKLKIDAPAGYGISLTINSMNLNFRRDQYSGSISCHDHVQFSPKLHSIVDKALNLISDKFHKSELICRKNYKMDLDHPELYDVGKTANIFFSKNSEVRFEYERGGERNRDKEFSIVATAFKEINGSCPEQYIRCGVESTSYCIAERLRCDGFVNCGFPRSGVDEEGCSVPSSVMSTHTFVWVSLVLALAVFICCLISCAMRCWVPSAASPQHPRLRLWFPGSSRSPAESRPTSSSGPAVPAERAHLSPLPSYDSVVRHLGDLQSPPSYKDLFPEPPPSPPGTDRLPLNPLLLKTGDETSEPTAPAPREGLVV